MEALGSPAKDQPGGEGVGTMTLRCTFERADVADAVRGQRAFRRLRRWLRPLMVVVLVVGVATVAVNPTPGSIGVLAAVVLWALAIETLPWWTARQQWRANPLLHGEFEFKVTPAGVSVRGPGTSSDHAWEKFARVDETAGAFLLCFSPKSASPFLMLPKRALPSADDLDALRALLDRMIRSR